MEKQNQNNDINTAVIIYKLLEESQAYRDDDRLLYSAYVKKALNISEEQLRNNFYEYYTKYYKYNLHAEDSISRLRRKLQETDREQGTYLIQNSYYIKKLRKEKEKMMRETYRKE